MNIKEVNRVIESELGICPETGFNILQFYALRKNIKCNGKYEDLFL